MYVNFIIMNVQYNIIHEDPTVFPGDKKRG